MNARTSVILTFNDVFPEEKEVSIANYVKEIPSIQALEIVSHLSAQVHINESRREEKDKEAMQLWLGRLPFKTKKKFIDASKEFIQKGNLVFINQPACLYLIQELILNYNDKEKREITPKDELNLLKAYLLASSKITEIANSLAEKGLSNFDDLLSAALCSQLPINDLKKSREFYIQVYKAVLFFEFCEKNKGLSKILNEFLSKSNLDDWREYLKIILSTYTSLVNFKGEGNKSVLETNEKRIIPLLENMVLDIENFEKKPDYISIREKPLFKYEKNKYLFLNFDLFVDKLFNGILFDIYSKLENSRYEEIKVKNFLDFKSFVGENFTEKELLYGLIDHIIDDEWEAICGQKLQEDIKGEPDYYLRRRSKIFLFECKDTLFSSKAKNSNNLEEIKSEIQKKIITGEDKKKGISQLLSFISHVDDKLFEVIEEFKIRDVKFYPIIVVTDRSFDEMGINYHLKQKTVELIDKLNLSNLSVKNPIILQIDDLIKFLHLFRRKKIKLNSIIDDYNSSVDSNNFFVATVPFSDFLSKRAYRIEGKLDVKDHIVDDVIRRIFD